MKDKKTFGSFIKEKRMSKNYSQKDLAELLYITESAVSKWERGVTYPDITLITELCKVLDVSEKELIQSGDDDEYRKMKRDADKLKKIKRILFWSINISYFIAILTCFIVNIAVDHRLSWFFIVLTAILVSYSFCPTITWVYTKYKKLIFLASSFVSLFLLFLTCSIYTNDYWFLIPTVGVLLLYFLIFYPILFTNQKKFLDTDKYKRLSRYFLLTYSIGILLLIILLLVVIYCYSSFNFWLGFIITTGCMIIPIIFGFLVSLNLKKGVLKVILMIFLSLIVAGLFIGFARAIYLKTTEKTKTFIIEEAFNKISIDVETEDIDIYYSNNENKMVFNETNEVSLEVKLVNDTLIICIADERKFYDQMFDFTIYKLDLFLSKDIIENIDIKCSTGDINIHDGLNVNNLKINNSTGDIEASNCDLGCLDINTSTGNIDLKNVGCQKLNIEITTGNTKLTNVLVEEDLNINGSTGNVYLNDFDAKNIYIKLSTGNVKGTILTNKFFIVSSSTGDVVVPETRYGGKCKISTSTGNIIVKYKD